MSHSYIALHRMRYWQSMGEKFFLNLFFLNLELNLINRSSTNIHHLFFSQLLIHTSYNLMLLLLSEEGNLFFKPASLNVTIEMIQFNLKPNSRHLSTCLCKITRKPRRSQERSMKPFCHFFALCSWFMLQVLPTHTNI